MEYSFLDNHVLWVCWFLTFLLTGKLKRRNQDGSPHDQRRKMSYYKKQLVMPKTGMSHHRRRSTSPTRARSGPRGPRTTTVLIRHTPQRRDMLQSPLLHQQCHTWQACTAHLSRPGPFPQSGHPLRRKAQPRVHPQAHRKSARTSWSCRHLTDHNLPSFNIRFVTYATNLMLATIVTKVLLSGLMTKSTKCMCVKRRLRSAWASAQSDQSSLSAQWVAKDPSFLHADSEDWSNLAYAQADLNLRWALMPFCWFCHEATPGFAQAWKVFETEGQSWKVPENKICLEKYLKTVHIPWKVLEFHIFLYSRQLKSLRENQKWSF